MMLRLLALALGIALLGPGAPGARAEIDGHGPDSWRVTGVAGDDMLNARMGPGTRYKVIERFAPNERGLEQITCVPFYALRHSMEMSEAEIAALPSRWCLMRSADMTRAGWVSARYIAPDDREVAPAPSAGGADPVSEAQSLVRGLYAAFEGAQTRAENPFLWPEAEKYFFDDVVPMMAGQGADVLYDAQDFQGEVTRIAPDHDQPMLRGMVTINVDFTNWGRAGRAVFRLRADTSRPGAPVRIFRIEIGDTQYP